MLVWTHTIRGAVTDAAPTHFGWPLTSEALIGMTFQEQAALLEAANTEKQPVAA